jgi:photosystem II stability/assembly factor-like uncharacterized protein
MKIIYNLAFLYFLQTLFSCNQALEIPKTSLITNILQNQITDLSGTAKIVFKSTDGGQTWQNISKGLPEDLEEDGIKANRNKANGNKTDSMKTDSIKVSNIKGNSFFANDNGLFVRIGNVLYHSAPNATAPFWTKENISNEHSSIIPVQSALFALNYWGVNLKKTNGMNIWSPIFENFQEPRIRSTFETAGGAIFLGTDRGFFKTADNGQTWKHVHTGILVGHLAESGDVLVAISNKGIIRSTDNGENWAEVSSGGGVAWDVKPIKGGFVAITSSSESNTRGLSTSYDGGKTWQTIDAGPQNKVFRDSIWRTWNDRPRLQAAMSSVIQVGENYFSAYPDGMFRSTDKGKTWKLLLPSVEDKVFNLFVSGNVIYAIPRKGGC